MFQTLLFEYAELIMNAQQSDCAFFLYLAAQAFVYSLCYCDCSALPCDIVAKIFILNGALIAPYALLHYERGDMYMYVYVRTDNFHDIVHAPRKPSSRYFSGAYNATTRVTRSDLSVGLISMSVDVTLHSQHNILLNNLKMQPTGLTSCPPPAQ